MMKVYDRKRAARAKKTPLEAGFARGHVITDRVNRCQLRPSAQKIRIDISFDPSALRVASTQVSIRRFGGGAN
jgi:hypothetical protein